MKVIAFPRNAQGSGASRRLRKAGQVPGIIYGGANAPVMIALDQNALFYALKKEAFHSSILDMEIEGKVEKVLLRDFQMHAYKQFVLHADFQRVDATKQIHVKVPLHFVNAETSPAVKLGGAVINHVMNELDVSCLPGDLPEFVEVDLANMEAGASLHLNDLKLPNGITAILHGQDNPTIATAMVPAGQVSAEDAAAGEDADKK
jgi:large subunit ribosomal protein L25